MKGKWLKDDDGTRGKCFKKKIIISVKSITPFPGLTC
jgi:hypothetical protein